MHQGLVGFPAVGTCVIAGPSNKELHTGSTARGKCRGTQWHKAAAILYARCLC